MIQELKFNNHKSALVIVAHPDDETIWMGGFILKHLDWRWTIFSLCRASDSDRTPKFKRACRYYKAKAIITDVEDEDKLSIVQTIPVIKKQIVNKVGPKEFDCIFTHGANGEYKHPRHIGVYQAVKELIKEKVLKAKIAFYFNYVQPGNKEFAPLIAKKNSDLIVKLTKQEFSKKKSIMTDIYGFDREGIDVGYCTNPEAFKIM